MRGNGACEERESESERRLEGGIWRRDSSEPNLFARDASVNPVEMIESENKDRVAFANEEREGPEEEKKTKVVFSIAQSLRPTEVGCASPPSPRFRFLAEGCIAFRL